MSLPIADIASFTLTQAELLFMLRLLELPDLPGIGEKPWGNIDFGTAQSQFKEAGLALKERGWVHVDENRIASILPELQGALSISAYPDKMMSIAYKDAQGKTFDIRHYRRENWFVRHTQTDIQLHEFTLFNKTDMGLQDLLDIFRKYLWSSNIPAIDIPSDVYEKSLGMAVQNRIMAEKLLTDAGVSVDSALNLIQAFINYEMKIYVQWIYELNPNLNLSSLFIWGNEDVCWVAETSLLEQGKKVKVMALSSEFLARLLISGQQRLIAY
jgi:hypothetical protein